MKIIHIRHKTTGQTAMASEAQLPLMIAKGYEPVAEEEWNPAAKGKGGNSIGVVPQSKGGSVSNIAAPPPTVASVAAAAPVQAEAPPGALDVPPTPPVAVRGRGKGA